MKNRLSPLHETPSLKEDLQVFMDYLNAAHIRNRTRAHQLLNMATVAETTRYVMHGNRVIPHSNQKTLVLWVHRPQ